MGYSHSALVLHNLTHIEHRRMWKTVPGVFGELEFSCQHNQIYPAHAADLQSSHKTPLGHSTKSKMIPYVNCGTGKRGATVPGWMLHILPGVSVFMFLAKHRQTQLELL